MNTNEEIIEDMNKFLTISYEASKLRYEKLKCYGIESYSKNGIYGILIRVSDKIARVMNFYENIFDKNTEINKSFLNANDSVRDNLIDSINYLTMAVILLDNKYNKIKNNININETDNSLPQFDILYKLNKHE